MIFNSTPPYNSIFTGLQIDENILRAVNAVLISDIQVTLGEQTDKPISQATVTAIFKKTPEWFETLPLPSQQFLTKVAFVTTDQAPYKAGHIYQCLQNSSGYYWNDVFSANDVLSVNGKTGDVILTASDVNAPSNEEFETEKQTRILADQNLQNEIDNIQSIQILNKDVITATFATVQTVCTNYIVAEYSRQPKNLDGLIITITDSSPPNDKIQYVYSGFSNVWVDVGSSTIDIGEATYTTKGIVQIVENTGLQVANGLLSGDNATNISLGMVKVGSGISVANGTISTNQSLIGLGNVNNTSDINKPISTATQNALNLKANTSNTVTQDTTQVISGNKTFSGISTFNGNIVANSVTITPFEFSFIDGINSNIQQQLDTKYSSTNTPPYPVTSVNGQTGAVIITASDIGSVSSAEMDIAIGVETDARILADQNLQNEIDNIQSIQILNKDVITATFATVQTVCTNYIVAEYSRQPKNLDGLIITITDSSPPNDKIQYVYSGFSNVWVDVGSSTIDIGEATYTTKGIVQIVENTGLDIVSGNLSINNSIVRKFTTQQQTLLVANWTNENKQTLNISGKTSDLIAWVTATQMGTDVDVLKNQKDISEANLYKIIDNGTSLTFVCENLPTNNLIIQISLGG